MNDLLDDNNFFIFDDVNVRISLVSKMPFRKKPHDSMHVRSKSNMIKSLPTTVHKWLPKLKPLAEPIAKWFPRVKRCSKHMMGNRALLMNFVEMFLGMVRFGNNDFAVIAGYGDVVIVCKTRTFALRDKPHSFFAPEGKPPQRGLNPRPLACGNNLPKVTLGGHLIKKVYYVESLGHNLFSVGQFCDKGLEVTFQKSTCF
nr:integrase, catalytic region, zinc finger, CCHC-type, peptidase aspartic, catalytic [Tanacetum cinerariifolium]